ncbi:hypothetical protein Tco_1499653 [Tanacetum coccineum]
MPGSTTQKTDGMQVKVIGIEHGTRGGSARGGSAKGGSARGRSVRGGSARGWSARGGFPARGGVLQEWICKGVGPTSWDGLLV